MDMETLLAEVGRYSVPELCDGMELYHTMSPAIRQMVGEQRMVGTVFTKDASTKEFTDYLIETIDHLLQ